MSEQYKVFPWWKGYILSTISGLRKRYQNPETILKDYIKENMVVADIGCGMGYFSLPMSDMVGSNGKVVAVDLQKQMLNEVKAKSKKQKTEDRFEFVNCSEDSLNLDEWNEKLDFVLIFAVAHEVGDRQRLFKEATKIMKKGAKMLFAEPKGHVTRECFEESVDFARACGLKLIDCPEVNRSYSMLFEK